MKHEDGQKAVKEVSAMGKAKIDGGSIRSAKDGSGDSAMTTSKGAGSDSDPNVRTTTTFDSEGSVKDSHTTVRTEDDSGNESETRL